MTDKDAIFLAKINDYAEKVLGDTGYMGALTLENTVESKTRIDNLGEFLSAVSEYEKTAAESGMKIIRIDAEKDIDTISREIWEYINI